MVNVTWLLARAVELSTAQYSQEPVEVAVVEAYDCEYAPLVSAVLGTVAASTPLGCLKCKVTPPLGVNPVPGSLKVVPCCPDVGETLTCGPTV